MMLLIRDQFLCVIFAIVSFWSYFQLMICESLRKKKQGSDLDLQRRCNTGAKRDGDPGKALDSHFTFALQMGC